ncbi:MAG: type II secretion system protein [Gammaproteobacteria bacterium]
MTRIVQHPGGFTLIELALVLAILGSITLAALGPLGAHIEMRARRSTSETLDAAIEALYGFALMHGRLPCPDLSSDADGHEDRRGERACMVDDGLLPGADLGIDARDAWRRPLRYHVTAALEAEAPGPNFAAADDGVCRANDGDLDLCERGVIVIVTRGDDPRSSAIENKALFVLANSVPAVVLSHGANGAQAALAASYDEAENADGDHRFVARDYSAGDRACSDDDGDAVPLCPFDDLLRWVSPTVLASRLVRGGRLP